MSTVGCKHCEEARSIRLAQCPECHAALGYTVPRLTLCCVPTAEERALLASGDHTPEELWGGSRPTCPKCIDQPPALGGEPQVVAYPGCTPPTTFGEANAQLKAALDLIAGLTRVDARLSADNVALRDRISQRLIDLTNMRHERDTLKTSAAEDKVVLSTLTQQVTDYQRLAHDRKLEADTLKARCEGLEAELTKAQELIQRAEGIEGVSRYSDLRKDMQSFLAHQTAPAAKDEHDYRTDLSCYFGLSHASWLTLPRVLMEAMPESWKAGMAALLHQYDDAMVNPPDVGTTVRITSGGKMIETPGWLLNYRHPDKAMIDQVFGRTAAEDGAQ